MRHPGIQRLAQMLFGAMVVAGAASCTDRPVEEDPIVARAYERLLRWSDLRRVVPVDADPLDSAAIAQGYITTWLRQQVLLERAERNLGPERTAFESQLQDYRNSLVIFAYEEALVEQKLDTVVGRAEIEDYFKKNEGNFMLRDNILRVRWFKVREPDRRAMKKLQDHFLSGNAERMREVEVWLAERNVPIMDRSAGWATAGELKAEIPVWALQVPEDRTEPGRMVLRDEEGAYFVDILELRRKDSVSPLALVERDVRSIIINQRKVQLLERMREDIYQEAQAQGHVEVH